jgi:hypothetical protein
MGHRLAISHALHYNTGIEPQHGKQKEVHYSVNRGVLALHVTNDCDCVTTSSSRLMELKQDCHTCSDNFTARSLLPSQHSHSSCFDHQVTPVVVGKVEYHTIIVMMWLCYQLH